jgi:hypothetical protein
MWGAIGNTWEQQKSKKSNMCPSHPPQKEKKTWSIGAIPHWVEVLFLWLYIYMFVFLLLLFFSSPTLARLMAGACLQGHSFNPIFLSSTRPLHTFLLYIWGVHLCWWLVFWSIWTSYWNMETSYFTSPNIMSQVANVLPTSITLVSLCC